MIKPHRIRLEYGKVIEAGYCIIEGQSPSITWAINSAGAGQAAYRIVVRCGNHNLWDTSWVETHEQKAVYKGQAFIPGEKNRLSLEVRDHLGHTSQPVEKSFYYGSLEKWPARWIGELQPQEDKVIYFSKTFECKKEIETACLFVCGIGYQRIFINGKELDEEVAMNPAVSEYEKRCYYTVLPGISGLRKGENRLGVQVAAGWRSPYNVCYKLTNRIPDFTGISQLSAALKIRYQDGEEEWVYTDESWKYQYGGITYSNIFMGETYEPAKEIEGWTRPGILEEGSIPVRIVKDPGGVMTVQTLEPVRTQEVYPAICISEIKKGTYGVDFGQNIAGVTRIRLPLAMKPGQTITISHMEFLDEDGTLYLPNLRNAACIDRYIAAGNGRDREYWQPRFTYHGFRYAEITGYGEPIGKDDICAVSLYTDIATRSSFRCGSAIVNAIQKNIVQTEKANIHSILTDCPQRDERMGWLNDGTVRFEETPYNFDIGRLFPKVVRDILDVQDPNGSITCTAPFVFGARPADPVCSAFLIAAWESYMHTGNIEVIIEGYEGFKAWNNFLESKSEDYIVQYSYYGDWAGPAYVCKGEDGALSTETPGILMSTGFFYFNTKLLTRMADLLGKDKEAEHFEKKAGQIRAAFLKKWWDEETGKVGSGSQGGQSFALWLGILPSESTQKAADVLHCDLVERNYLLTTGNLCTRYMMEVLTKYGYIEDAWTLITREDYPSFGFMLQQEATTIWERFELKKSAGMNSHNHPMYGAVGYWFYACLAGVKPLESGYRRVSIRPCMPEKLLSVQAIVETVMGDIVVRWVKRYGQIHLYVTIPLGVTAEVIIPDGLQIVGGGFHHWSSAI